MGKTAFITGANQGLGLGLVQRLAETYTSGDTIYMGVRRMTAGEEALGRLEGFSCAIEPIYIDVTEEKSIREAAETVKQRHGGLDLLISNAAARISKETPYSEQVERFITTNNTGTYLMLKTFAPLIRKGGVLMVVASAFGSLLHLPGHLHGLFDVDRMSMEDLSGIMTDYVEAVKEGEDIKKGWPQWINIPSKIGQVALVKIAARNLADTGIHIFSVCPGLVDTDASRPFFDNMEEAQSPYAAAGHLIDLAGSPGSHKNGELIQFGTPLPWK